MTTKIALAGNPNSGKTTMFNSLTGSTQHVGNWPGVTVEKKDGKLKGHKNVIVQDLPGIYSLSPYTLEEVVTRNYLIGEKPNVVINIVDASNIERNLYLTTQLLEIGVPVVIALNMIDIVRKNGDTINLEKLSQILGCEIVETAAIKGLGAMEAAEMAISLAQKQEIVVPQHEFHEDVEKALHDIAELIKESVTHNLRWFSIKLFERDEEVLKTLTLPADTKEQINTLIQQCEDRFGDDSESIITTERYLYIGKVIDQCVTFKRADNLSTSDKIDKVVTNRILALPIFAVAMFLVYFLSITTVGTMMTDWINESVFGDGFHLTGGSQYEEKVGEYEVEQAKVNAFLTAAKEQGINTEAVEKILEDKEPSEEDKTTAKSTLAAFVMEAESKNITATAVIEDEEDKTSESYPISVATFSEAVAVEEPAPEDFGTWIPGVPTLVTGFLDSMGTSAWLKGLIVDGAIAGVGAVLGFLPQMLVLFLCLALLEQCGYMARIAFILDRIFRKFGLSGKSFIPMLVGMGCGVPGIMASRTIENENDRRMTVITTTFIPCGAKLPIIALIAGALFDNSAWISASAYFLGIGAIIISGIILKKTKSFVGNPAPFVMELPTYHMPRIKGVIKSSLQRGKAFVRKAFTIIFISSIIIWFLQSFNWSFEMVELNDSMLASIGYIIEPIFTPLGWGDWRAAVASITGLVAKENVVGTFGVLYEFGEVSEEGVEIWDRLAQSFTPISAYSFLIFNLLCAPCFAAIGAVRREMMSTKWTLFTIAYQTTFAYIMAFIFFNIANPLWTLHSGKGSFSIVGLIIAFVALGGVIYALARKPYSPKV